LHSFKLKGGEATVRQTLFPGKAEKLLIVKKDLKCLPDMGLGSQKKF
jgi:hypothetical protein